LGENPFLSAIFVCALPPRADLALFAPPSLVTQHPGPAFAAPASPPHVNHPEAPAPLQSRIFGSKAWVILSACRREAAMDPGALVRWLQSEGISSATAATPGKTAPGMRTAGRKQFIRR